VGELRSTDYRIRSGIHAVGDITTTYKITNFATQTDQSGMPWMAPNAFRTVTPIQAQVVQTLDMAAHADGFYTWQWAFDYLTNDMLGYWFTTYLAASVKSATVTVKTFDATDTAVHLTGVLLRPESGQHMEVQQGGWQNVIMRFIKGVIIT
jgi:hypothetical protein